MAGLIYIGKGYNLDSVPARHMRDQEITGRKFDRAVLLGSGLYREPTPEEAALLEAGKDPLPPPVAETQGEKTQGEKTQGEQGQGEAAEDAGEGEGEAAEGERNVAATVAALEEGAAGVAVAATAVIDEAISTVQATATVPSPPPRRRKVTEE